MATRPFRRSPSSNKGRALQARSVTCKSVMDEAHTVLDSDSVAVVLDTLTRHDWDHVFIVNSDDVPLGRIHAVDLLKMVARKSVNRNIAWMHSIPAQQLVNLPPLTIRSDAPLLKAGALMLTHDLNQLGVVDEEGALVGVVAHSTLARVLPKFIL